jgi:hypothetical protein
MHEIAGERGEMGHRNVSEIAHYIIAETELRKQRPDVIREEDETITVNE